ncbi:GntR family transcriptional regulator [Rhodosalinus sp. FB01]|uniref:GntR family transcriptional regulator n=1 Tax=Rhodosalinus sp. FB01 TaxID=3239194 RepID=UPI003524A655
MTTGRRPAWRAVHDEALRRIQTREWQPGELIPSEVALARELGHARATVNRALRALAKQGLLERRRRAGTRVAEAPQRRALLSVPIVREEVEERGARYAHALIARGAAPVPEAPRLALGLAPGARAERVRALHLADGRPYAWEDRWVNLAAAPGFAAAPLDEISANEWLVRHAPFDRGTLDYAAEPASADAAAHLGCAPGTPVMVLERATQGPDAPVTWVRLAYAPGYRLRMKI